MGTIRGELAALVAVAVLAAYVPPAGGAEAPAATLAIQGIGPTSIYDWPLHVAVALAAASLAFVVGLGLTMRRNHLIPPRLVKQLAELIDKGGHGQAIDLCESRSGCLCRVVGAGLSERHGGLDAMLAASRAARKKEFELLRWRLYLLLLIIVLDMVVALALGRITGGSRMLQLVVYIGDKAIPADPYAYIPFDISASATLLTFLAYAFFGARAVELPSEIEAAANRLLLRARPKD